jgi:uncharacterized membrane protein YeaQ/YmgE (transglycosylase-associated protein family)
MFLALLSWIVVGAVVGFIGSKLVNLRGDTPLIGMGAAAGGAVVAGLVHALMFREAVLPWDLWNLVFAAAGAAASVLGYHVIRGLSISKDRQSIRSSY